MKRDYFVHETACIDEPVEIGAGTKIWHYTHVMKGAKIGNNCKIGQNVYIASTAVIGDNVKIQNNVSIYDGVILEDNVFCGPSMVFTNVLNPRCEYPQNKLEDYKKTFVRKGTTIGANATVLCGITLGCYAFIGAGAVVTRDVPDYALVYGNPARVNGWVCECGGKLNWTKSNGKTETASCRNCKRQYIKEEGAGVRRTAG